MASMSLCLPPRLCLHRLHWRPHGVVYQPTSMLNGSALVSKSGSTSSRFLDLRLREGYRILRCSASTNGDTATPESPVSPETTNGSVRSSSRKPQVWVAIGIAIVAVGLVVSGIVRTNNLFGSNQREASQLLTDMSISASSSQSVEQFTVNWFGRKFFLSERSPGYMYFLLLMAAGFGLFVSEEALNVWVGGTLGRMLIWNQSRDAFLSSLSANLPYILSTVIWVYWGVCISDMVPFFAGRQAAKSGTGNRICEKLGVSQEKFDKIKANVQRHGNLIGIVERFSLGIRNPTSFLAGFVGINPTNYFAGVCAGGLITLPLQLSVGVVLRDRPVAALAGVAAVVGIWTLLPYVAAGIGSVVYFTRQRGSK
ncbi:uncharacterized protein [Physcomitrium patens]|uniref:Uncharacterized protein n=3 Tax=Physcomitrium patens TaxID=3218 RepID=A0A7I4FH30_PHYPA|nr:uncharacterized protein LOC112276745 isoform X2 [Physcomitrium patens]|eukprot:XP_024364148.1 uncharacterized protein LOC112276745 isoform X2 [Physcomitrella patens]